MEFGQLLGVVECSGSLISGDRLRPDLYRDVLSAWLVLRRGPAMCDCSSTDACRDGQGDEYGDWLQLLAPFSAAAQVSCRSGAPSPVSGLGATATVSPAQDRDSSTSCKPGGTARRPEPLRAKAACFPQGPRCRR